MSRYILARRHAASRHGRSHVCFMQIKYETWTRMRTNEQWQSAIFKLIFYNVTNFFWSRSLTISDVLPKWFSWKKKNCIYTRLGSDFSLMSYRKGGRSTLCHIGYWYSMHAFLREWLYLTRTLILLTWNGFKTNKAGYTATQVACGWAGIVFEVNRPFGQERWHPKVKIMEKVKRDQPTDQPTDGQSGVLSRVHETKNNVLFCNCR